ncbi:Recombination protein RecR [bioreactor metagenome]|uniref:Recombination protein RecR n=1 Tax=bioreactor metagenome TaxID=1076179 RepID=A0A644ZHL9_9ZZZZ|nr:recombination mediator RecR [Erysipelotrichaceae bacterium]
MYPSSLQKLIDSFRLLPGVGMKTAERYAFEVLEMTDDEALNFIKAISDSKAKLSKCKTCGNLSEGEECLICMDKHRDHQVICVVQHAKDVLAMEKIQEYHGVYHVLGGVIATSKGILPSDLNIASLLNRVNENTKEVIIATNPTLEGETTAMYLAKILHEKNIMVTRIANGLPMGGHLDYADELTLTKAMEGRQRIK